MDFLANDFPYLEVQKFIPIFESADVIDHMYGAGTPIPDDRLVWMQYTKSSNKNFKGNISFSRNTNLYVPEFTNLVGKWLEEKTGLQINYTTIHMMKTVGDIMTHIDEGPRHSVINIGVLRSSRARTVYYSGTTRMFERVGEGEAYLMDVKSPHSVEADDDEPRYVITYSMPEQYKEVKARLGL